MAVHTLPRVGAVELTGLDYVNLALGLGLLVAYPVHALVSGAPLSLLALGLSAGAGLGIWVVTLWMGLRDGAPSTGFTSCYRRSSRR